MMGVLAGFAMTALTLVLPRSVTGPKPRDGILALLVAMIGLLASAFMYASAAGARAGQQQAAAMAFSSALVAVAALANLFFGLQAILASAAGDQSAERASWVVSTVIPFFTTIYIGVSAVNVVRVDPDRGPWLGSVALLLLPSLLGLIFGKVMIYRKDCDEVVIAVTTMIVSSASFVYFLILFYVAEAAQAVWPVASLLAIWITFVPIFMAALRRKPQADGDPQSGHGRSRPKA